MRSAYRKCHTSVLFQLMKHELLPVKVAPGFTIHSVHKNTGHNSNWCTWHFPISPEHICTVTWSPVWDSYDWFCHFCKWKFCTHKCMRVPVLSLCTACPPQQVSSPLSQKPKDDVWEMKVLIPGADGEWHSLSDAKKYLQDEDEAAAFFFLLLWLVSIWCCWSHLL